MSETIPEGKARSEAPLFDLVAVAYRAPVETEAFFQSVRSLQLPVTVTIVNNDEANSTVARIIEKWQDIFARTSNIHGVTVVHRHDNPGYARACNEGASRGDAPYIGLLNCDIQFMPGVLEAIASHFQDNPDVGVIGPRTKTTDGRLTHAGILQEGMNDRHRFWLQRDAGQGMDVIDVPTVSGATYFVRREMWEELTLCPSYQRVAPMAQGAFLPTQHFFEETFCSYHAWAHGWAVRYLGTATMIHEWHRSSSPGAPESSGRFAESREYFLRACREHGIEGRA